MALGEPEPEAAAVVGTAEAEPQVVMLGLPDPLTETVKEATCVVAIGLALPELQLVTLSLKEGEPVALGEPEPVAAAEVDTGEAEAQPELLTEPELVAALEEAMGLLLLSSEGEMEKKLLTVGLMLPENEPRRVTEAEPELL